MISVAGGSDDSYDFEYVSGTLTINKATALVTIEGLEQEADGTPKTPNFSTDPAGLTLVITYDGAAEAPISEGTYEVVATVDEQNYQGSATATLVLNSSEEILSVPGDHAIAMYPNPASESVSLVAEAGQRAQLLDFHGRVMRQVKVEQRETKIDVSQLVRGLYVLRLVDGDEVVATKKILLR